MGCGESKEKQAGAKDCGEHKEEMKRNKLHDAAMKGHTECVKAFLAQGMDPNLRGGVDDNTALHFIVMANKKNVWFQETAKALIDGGADPQVTNGAGSTVLEYAEDFGAAACAQGLRDMGAHYHEEAMGRNKLHDAASKGCTSCVRLLSKTIDINSTGGEHGGTCFHYIVLAHKRGHWHKETAKALVELGADINKVNNDGDTPLQYARDFGANAVVAGLLELGAHNDAVAA